MSRHERPRSLLFLSCDLTGSTDFKQRTVDGSWRYAFLQFYREFPQAVASAQTEMDTKSLSFDLWKAVGDELIFTVEVRSDVEIFDAVKTWLRAMHSFTSDHLDANGLGAKGGAFIATFPGPDSESSIPRKPEFETSDANVAVLNKQALAGNRSLSKFLYDFFGPSIDTGFRVLSRCSARHFTLSLEVAYALSVAETMRAVPGRTFPMHDMVLLETVELKGVWSGRGYPVFAFDTQHGDPVHRAMAPFSPGSIDANHVRKLCEAVYESAGWPCRLYLPDSHNEAFHVVPRDPLAAEIEKAMSMEGAEEPAPDVSESTTLPSSADLAFPGPEIVESNGVAARSR